MTIKASHADLAQPGAEYAVRATPRARKPGLSHDGTSFRIAVTAPPEDGRANAEIARVLAQALGVAKSRLTLLRGATARDKIFRLD